VLSGRTTPHVVFAGAEDHLAGYTGLPLDLNPYRKTYGASVRAAGAVLPLAGAYDLVFDSQLGTKPGPFTFRYWVNDVIPPKLRVLSTRGRISVSVTDAGSGVDPSSIAVTVDGHVAAPRVSGSTLLISATKGRHVLEVRAADYQETKNMEDVPPILPNSSTLRTSVVVR
jgi:hypothetical protein